MTHGPEDIFPIDDQGDTEVSPADAVHAPISPIVRAALRASQSFRRAGVAHEEPFQLDIADGALVERGDIGARTPDEADKPEQAPSSTGRHPEDVTEEGAETPDTTGHGGELPPRPPVPGDGTAGEYPEDEPGGDGEEEGDDTAAADSLPDTKIKEETHEDGDAVIIQAYETEIGDDITRQAREDDLVDDAQAGVHGSTVHEELHVVCPHPTIDTYGEVEVVANNQWVSLSPDPEIVAKIENIRDLARRDLEARLRIRTHDDLPIADMEDFCTRLGLEPKPVFMFEGSPEAIEEFKRFCTKNQMTYIRSGRPIYEGRLGWVLSPISYSRPLRPSVKLDLTVCELIRSTSTSTIGYVLDELGGIDQLDIMEAGFDRLYGYQESGRALLIAGTYMQTYQPHPTDKYFKYSSDYSTNALVAPITPPKYLHRKTENPSGPYDRHRDSVAAIGIELLVARNSEPDIALLDAFLYGSTSPAGILMTAQLVNAIEPGLWERMSSASLPKARQFDGMTQYILSRFHNNDPYATLHASNIVDEVMREKLGKHTG